MRRLVALLLISLLAVPAAAQSPSTAKPVRVRITGADTYQVPGVIEIQRDRISGSPVATTDHFIQFIRSADGRLLSVPRPRQRVTGNARAVADELLEFIPDGESERLYVPLDGVEKIEVSRVSHSRLISSLAGVGTGVATFIATALLFLFNCPETEGWYALGFSSAIGGGALVGGAVGRQMRGQRWEVISSDELGALLSAPPHSI
jgi:hypothetical protein